MRMAVAADFYSIRKFGLSQISIKILSCCKHLRSYNETSTISCSFDTFYSISSIYIMYIWVYSELELNIDVWCGEMNSNELSTIDTSSRTFTMGFRHISRDVKLAAIRLYELNLLSLEDILHCVGFSERTFYQILALWRDTGDVVKPKKTRLGRPQSLDYDDLQYLLILVRDNPDYFLDELLDLLKKNCFISIHYTTIHRELEQAGVSRKKLKRIALERDENWHAAYIIEMSQYTPHQLGFLNETSKDMRTPSRAYGRSKKGRRAQKKQAFLRGRCVSTEALLSIDGIVARTVVEGSMTRAMFLDWMEFDVVSAITKLSQYCITPS